MLVLFGVILAGVVVEAVVLWRRLAARWPRRRLLGLLANLMAGASLVFVGAAALAGASATLILAALTVALVAHLTDLTIRLNEPL